MRLLLLATLLTGAASSCARHAVPTAGPGIMPPGGVTHPRTVSTIPINTAPGDTALVFQRTPCHGRCPAYTATIFRNGKVSYVGDRFVPVTGSQTLSLPQPTVQAMLDEARNINFASFKGMYQVGATDLPAVIVTVYLPGQHPHRVMTERQAAPPALLAYLDHLAAQIDPLAGILAGDK